MSIEIKLAEINDINTVYDFYTAVCKALEHEKYSPLWKIGTYPCVNDIKNHIINSNMYIALKNNRIVSAMAITDHGNYSSLHLFAVHHDYRNQHIGRKMMEKMFSIAKERKNDKIILDVVKDNLPAEKLYQKIGFKYIGEKTEIIEKVGNVCFCIYECAV